MITTSRTAMGTMVQVTAYPDGADAKERVEAAIEAAFAEIYRLTADALDDAVFVLGPEKGLALIERTPGVGAVIVDAENRLIVSKRLKSLLTVLHPPTDAA